MKHWATIESIEVTDSLNDVPTVLFDFENISEPNVTGNVKQIMTQSDSSSPFYITLVKKVN